MKLVEALQRALKYEKGLVRNYEQYAEQVDNADVARRFKEFAQQGLVRSEEIQALIKEHCRG
ncbi:MAG: hypothetical protein ACYCX4_13430 [Bacillota bacterium]